jgi:hypothetical protein
MDDVAHALHGIRGRRPALREPGVDLLAPRHCREGNHEARPAFK